MRDAPGNTPRWHELYLPWRQPGNGRTWRLFRIQRLYMLGVYKVVERDNPPSGPNMWKTFAVYSGAMLQFAVCMAVFGYLGHRLSVHMHRLWPTIAGVAFGVIVGVSGLAFLAKQILGDKP